MEGAWDREELDTVGVSWEDLQSVTTSGEGVGKQKNIKNSAFSLREFEKNR